MDATEHVDAKMDAKMDAETKDIGIGMSKSMAHVDALNRNTLPECLAIDETEAGLSAHLQKAQDENESAKKLRDLVQQSQAPDYVVRGGLLVKEVDADVRLMIPRRMQTQIIRRAHEREHFSISKTLGLIKNRLPYS